MDTRTILLLVVFCVSAHGFLDTDDTPTRRECGKGNKQFKKSQLYYYKYYGSIESGIRGITDELAKLMISAKVSIRFNGGCTFVMQLHNVQLTEKFGNNSKQTDTKSKQWLENDLQNFPLLFTLDQGLVLDIRPQIHERDVVVLNIKRSILSMFQLRWAKERDGFETDISGKCPITYQKSRKDGVRTIVKRKHLERCSERSMIHSVVKSVKYAKPVPWFDTSSSCEYRFRRKNEIEAIECSESFRMKPFSSSEASGGYTKSRQTMTLLRVLANKRTETYENFYVSSLLFEHEDRHAQLDRKKTESREEQAQAILKNLAIQSAELIQPKAATMFSDLVVSLRYLDEAELGKLVTSAQQCLFIRPCDLEQRLPFNSFLFDALAQCGSTPCVRVVSGIIIEGRIRPRILKQLVSSMALIQTPTTDMVDIIMDLHQKTQEPSVLSLLGTVVNNLCMQQGDDCDQQDSIRHAENYMLRLLGNDCTISDTLKANAILHALKAIGNAGRPLKARELVIDCARNAAHLNVSIVALHALKRMKVDGDLKYVLYEMVTDKNADTERRMEAFFILMSRASADDTLLVIDMINDQRDAGQLRSLMHSYVHSILRSQDPSKKRLREDFKNSLKVNNLTEFDLPVSRFSSFKSWSFYLDGIQVGATADAMMFFHPESFIPRTVRVNLTSHVLGNAINIMGLNLRTEGLEMLAAKFLKKDGYLSGSYLEKIFTIPDAMPGAQGMQSGRRSARSSGDMPRYQSRLEELQNEVNLKEPSPQFSLGLNVFGRELSLLTLEDMPFLTEGFDRLNIIEQLFALSQGASTSVQRNLFFLESQYILPTLLGFPLKLQVNGSVVSKLGIQGTVQVSNIFFGSKVLSMKGALSPSMSMELSGRLIVDGYFSKVGVHVNSSMYSASTLSGKLTYTEDSEFDVNVDVDEDPVELLNVSHNVFHVSGNSEVPAKQSEKEAKVNLCTNDVFNATQLFGVDLCGEVSFPVTFHEAKAPFFPLTGPSHLAIAIIPRDELLTNYNIRIKKTDDVYKVKISTPDSDIPREYVMDLGVSVTSNEGVIGASFGASRSGLMLRYQYDNQTHSVKAQLESNLTAVPVLLRGHYFNTTDPVTLEKKFGYQIGLTSEHYDIYDTLQFEDTYNFWAVESVTSFTNKDETRLRFQIQYDPQVISFSFKSTGSDSMVYWQVKPGFPSMSSYLNVTQGNNFSINGSGIIDLKRLVGEGELSAKPSGRYMKARFKWINEKYSKGLSARTVWEGKVATLIALFSLEGRERIFTGEADIEGSLYTTRLQFNRSHLDLDMNMNKYPIRVIGDVQNGLTYSGIELNMDMPVFGVGFNGVSKRQPSGHVMCLNVTFNSSDYQHCITTSFDKTSRKTTLIVWNPAIDIMIEMKRKMFLNGFKYTLEAEYFGQQAAKLSVESRIQRDSNSSVVDVSFPSFGYNMQSKMVLDRRTLTKTYFLDVEKNTPGDQSYPQYHLSAHHKADELRGVTNSTFTLKTGMTPQIDASIWSARRQSGQGLPALPSPLQKLGVSFTVSGSPMVGSIQNPMKVPSGFEQYMSQNVGDLNGMQRPMMSEVSPLFSASAEYVRKSEIVLRASLTRPVQNDAVARIKLSPTPRVTLRFIRGNEPRNVTEIILIPSVENGYTILKLKHPAMSKLHQLKSYKLKSITNKAITRFEKLLSESRSSFSKYENVKPEDISLEISKVTGQTLDRRSLRELVQFAKQSHQLAVKQVKDSRQVLRLKIRKLLNDITGKMAVNKEIYILKELIPQARKEGKYTKTKIGTFVMDLLQILADAKPSLKEMTSRQETLKTAVLSMLNSSLAKFFKVSNISEPAMEVITSYKDVAISLLFPLAGASDPTKAVDSLLVRVFDVIKSPDVNKVNQMYMSYLMRMLRNMKSSHGNRISDIPLFFMTEALGTFSNSMNSVSQGKAISPVVDEAMKSLSTIAGQCVSKIARHKFDSPVKANYSQSFIAFLTDMDLSQLVKNCLRISLEAVEYQGNELMLIDNLMNSNDFFNSLKTLGGVVISETSANSRVKDIFRNFLARPNTKSLIRSSVSLGLDQLNVSAGLKDQFMDIVNAEDATNLTSKLATFILGNVLLPAEYRGLLASLTSNKIEHALQNFTEMFLHYLEKVYSSTIPSGMYKYFLGKMNLTSSLESYLAGSPLASFITGFDTDFNLLLKEKKVYEFSRSMFKRLMQAVKDISSFENPMALDLIKKELVKQASEISQGILTFIPEEMQTEVSTISNEFIDVLRDADFTKATTNMTSLIHDVVTGWSGVLSSSKALKDLLSKASSMGADLGNMIDIDGVTIPELYKKFIQDFQNQVHLAAKIFGQFSNGKYAYFLRHYVKDGDIDFYKIYHDFLNANLSGTIFDEVDILVDALSKRALQEIQGRTGNYNFGTAVKNIIESIMYLNYSDINPVLQKYEKLDYEKYSNLSAYSLRDNLVQALKMIEEVETGGKRVSDHIRDTSMLLATYLEQAQHQLSAAQASSAKGMRDFKYIVDMARMNTTELLKAAFERLRQDTNSNKKIRTTVETLGMPILSALMNWISDSRVGNTTFYGVWVMSLDAMAKRPEISKAEVNTLWYITEKLGELKEADSYYSAVESITRIVDGLFRYYMDYIDKDLRQLTEQMRLVNVTMGFLKDFLRENSHLPLVQSIPNFLSEGREFALKQFNKSFILQMHYRALQPLFAQKVAELRESETIIVNKTDYIYKKVSMKVTNVLSSESLHNSVPAVITKASKLASTVIKKCLQHLDKARKVLKRIELFRNPKAYFGGSLEGLVRKTLKHWQDSEGAVFSKLNQLEGVVRDRLRQLDVKSKYFQKVISKSLDSSDIIVRNLTNYLKKATDSVDLYTTEMRSRFTTLSQEYIYRLFLNWDVLVKRVTDEFDKLYKGKDDFKRKSLIEVTEELSRVLKTWRQKTIKLTRDALEDYLERFSVEMKRLNKERTKSNRLLDSVRMALSANVTNFLKSIPKSNEFLLGSLLQKYDSAALVIDQYISKVWNISNMQTFNAMLENIDKSLEVKNGSISLIIPWIPSFLIRRGQEQDDPSKSNLQALPGVPGNMQTVSIMDKLQSVYVQGTDASALKQTISMAASQLERLQSNYDQWLIQQSQLFAGLALKYNSLVDNITVNATDYVLHLYEQRFLVPFKRITDEASIAAPVDSVPPMPTFPRAWSEATAMFKPMTRTAILYGSHIFTFDGQYVHTAVPSRLRSGCTYVLARDFRRGNFTLLYQGGSLIVESVDTKVIFKRGEKIEAYEKFGPSLTDLSGPFSDAPLQLGTTVITKDGPFYKMKSYYGFEVNCNTDYLLCNFTLSGFYHNKTLGLFGTNNEEFADDFRLPGGRIAVDMVEFLNEWELTQTDRCHLQSHQDFLYPCRRLPSPRCRQIFKDTRSPLARAFKNVNPSPFLAACEYETSKCDEYSTSRVAHCPIASAYVQLALSLGAKVSYLKECVICKDERKYENQVTANRLRRQLKAVDIVVLVRESENMLPFLTTLKRTLTKVETHMRRSGMDTLYRVVGFEGEGYRALPHMQTGNDEDAMNLDGLLDALDNLEFDGPSVVATRQGLSALRFAAGLPLRPLATKIFLLVDNDVSYSGRLREMILTNNILIHDGIILNTINNYRLKRGVIGKSAAGKRYHVKIPKGEQLRSIRFPPADDYVPIVRETGGAILTLKGLFSTDEKFLKAYPVSLSNIIFRQISSDLKLCKKCVCEQNRQGFGSIKCFKSKTKNC